MALQRQYQVKVFSQDNVSFVANLPLATEKLAPTFTSKINGGQGACVIDLNLPFDAFDEQ